ncbi:hypothetical protein [Bradyrhizobium liaoningense]|uniref:hypothetical protein n=1 Tax=Bradyrhizobium liaoningense TaxID=43992 RepID=UPI001BABAF65|nr:hypothetical protein [Bradyrhizobium liaoningense]MBR0947800.1 hypothetical protein [Bradyrhizobium liaoningense]
MNSGKPLPITKRMVWEAYKLVKKKGKAAGVDGQSLARLIRKSAPEGWRAWCKALMRRRIRLRSHPITFNRERHARHDR